MIFLIGLGIAYDITQEGKKLLCECDYAYCETHTMPVPKEYVEALSKECGKEITIIGREEVEGEFLLEKAMEGEGKNVCLLCGGDPLSATTHVSLLIDAKKRGIGTKVVHNSSIFSAALGKSGLQPYRFGKTVTVSFWRKNYEPTSPIRLIGKNLEAGMHTLVLLDLDKELGMMGAKEALGLLGQMEEREGGGMLPGKVVVLSRVGYEDEKITYGSLGELKKAELGKPPFCIAIPAKLHEVEKEYLEAFAGGK
ncbi:diphthine synthase [Candidatus Micrarchaeota archaeon]|nr:diphthine synthase [Candidatus Micrarchaeota archaeon]